MGKDLNQIISEAKRLINLFKKGKESIAFQVWSDDEFCKFTPQLAKEGHLELATYTGCIYLYKHDSARQAVCNKWKVPLDQRDAILNGIIKDVFTNETEDYPTVWQKLIRVPGAGALYNEYDNYLKNLYRKGGDRNGPISGNEPQKPKEMTPDIEIFDREDLKNLHLPNEVEIYFLMLLEQEDLVKFQEKPEVVLYFYRYLSKMHQNEYRIKDMEIGIPHYFIIILWLETKLNLSDQTNISHVYYERLDDLFPNLNRESIKAQKMRRLKDMGKTISQLDDNSPKYWQEIKRNFTLYYTFFKKEAGL